MVQTPEQKRAYQKVWRANHIEERRTANVLWRKRNKTRNRAKQLQWKKEHPDQLKKNERRHHLKQRYGLAHEDYEKLLRAQDGKCGICGRDKPTAGKGRTKHWYIDHDHKTKQVRGLLCYKCNTGLGQFNDDIWLLVNAIQWCTK
jgi:Recombination endonuclease VII